MSASSRRASRVFFINRFFHPDESATSRLVSGLAFSLADQGHQVTAVACRGSYMTSTVTHPKHELVDGVEIRRVMPSALGPTNGPRRLAGAIAFHLSAAAVLARRARWGDIVVVKTDPPLIGITITLVAATRGAKTIHWMQDIFPETAAQVGVPLVGGPLGAPLRWLRNWSIRRADMVVVIGDRMRGVVLGLGVAARRVVALSNWFDEAPGDLIETSDTGLRERLAGSADFVVGYSGNLGRVHPVDEMEAAVVALRDDRATHFVFIGAGVHRNELRKRASQQGLTNVSFHPYQDRAVLLEALQVPDVHLVVLAPELEGLIVPSKFYGVLAAGRPTIFIGDPTGEIARLIDEFGVGINVEAGDTTALVAAIRLLKDEPEMARDMGSRALQLYRQNYQRARAIADWDSLLVAVASDTEPDL